MKLDRAFTLKEFAEIINCDFIGDPNHLITGINEIHKVEDGDLVFVDHPKYYNKALESAATTILINKEVECPEGKGLLISEQPFDDFNALTKKFIPFKPWINDRGEEFEVGEGTHIHPNVSVGHHVTIGKNSMLHSGAVICDNTVIGDNVVVGPNTVIGHDAFYYKKKSTGYDRLHTCGRTILEDHVEIGALCTIDCGVTGDTIIGKGTKIDNQVHVGHDTVVGEDCLFAANVGIAGCVTIKNNVTLWGQVGIASDLTIHDGVTVLAQSGTNKDLEAGKTYFGSPCGEVRAKFREMAAMKRLPEILENL